MNKQEKYNLYSLLIILFSFFIGAWNSCHAQSNEYPQRIVLEMELEQVVKIKIPKNITTPKTVEELNVIKQIKQDKPIKEKQKIKETNIKIIKEEDYNENE